MELDHIFICSSKGASEASALLDFGLVEGTPNIHPGQGTANRRFFFHNMMIELLWIEDLSEVKNERTRPTQLFERLSKSNDCISPFGICFRPSNELVTQASFPTWEYNPIYLPSNLAIEFGLDTPLREPSWFYISFATRQDLFSEEKIQPMDHKIPLKEVTRGVVTITDRGILSKTAIEINKTPNFKIAEGDINLLELEFDNVMEGKSYDFRPILPLVFKW